MNDDENVRDLWSDEDLDIALATLGSTVDTDPDRLARSRAELIATATGTAVEAPVVEPLAEPASPSRRRTWGVVAAAAAVTVVASALVVGLVRSDDNLSPASAPEQLERAAENVRVEPVGPGQYRYIERHGWGLNAMISDDGMESARRGKESTTIWVPHDERDHWSMRDDPCVSAPLPDGETVSAEGCTGPFLEHRRCGQWESQVDPEIGCTEMGDWYAPNQLFFDSLPRDPDALRDRLLADYEARLRETSAFAWPPDPGPERRVMSFASDLLNSGLAPEDVRAAVYRMLAKVTGLQVTDPDASLDGRGGVAFGIVEGGVRYEIVVDPETGEYIGDREVYLSAKELVPAGTEFYTSVRTAVVDEDLQEP